jgi:uncharacterized membrane protein YfbV (UPF0208 family)
MGLRILSREHSISLQKYFTTTTTLPLCVPHHLTHPDDGVVVATTHHKNKQQLTEASMNRLIGVMIIIVGGIFFMGQVKVFRSEPLTVEELSEKREQLFYQLESLENNPERDSFAQTILKEIKTLDEQKVLLAKQKGRD